MPEGDTIHKIAAVMGPRLQGHVLRQAWSRHVGCDGLVGRTVTSVVASGKHLLVKLDGEVVLRSHLGLYGSWHSYGLRETWRKPEHRASLILSTDQEVYVCFNGKEAQIVTAGGIGARNFFNRLGPDLLGHGLDVVAVVARARELLEPDTVLADMLLDQRIGSGVGNVYKSEVLFVEAQHPRAALRHVSDLTLRCLYERARDLLQRNLGGGSRVTRFVNDGRSRLWVYGRGGQPCLRCDGQIRSQAMGRNMRSTYWCPQCQPAQGPATTIREVPG